MDLLGLTRAYFGGVALGGVLGGLTWPLDGDDGVADGLELVSPLGEGGVAEESLGVVEALGAASGVEAAGALAAVFAVEPVDAPDAMVWPDHQSFCARCVGEAFM
ncbi:hypothetical protein [Phenylobacterium sp.]|uniref:hypothetical protein n=1 Tax=Phenylobacterium sp. TaxID=1871053 RepID=UPI002E309230|nr:hypothetical protein [Phenylobacterium sp.]HEX4708875.1 hypothetical protein [Phenylobacterium sp.]